MPKPDRTSAASPYSAAGVDTFAAETALSGLLRSIKPTFALRPGIGRPLLPIGYYANVVDLGSGLGLAISTDGVGTKLLIAQMLQKYDTVGIDCVAMNVNDVICVGAEPIAMTDYLGVEAADTRVFEEIGKGLLKGAELASISIPGGEVAQIGEMLRGVSDGQGFDLVGTCVGVVATDRILIGQDLAEGDVVLGLASSGVHSNGLTLARKVLMAAGGYGVEDHVADFGRTLGEELLEPTIIYVRFAMAALRAGLPVKAFAHITGDGLLNLSRVKAPVGIDIESLPEIPAVFRLIQQIGDVPDEEMFRVFNMGIGFCVFTAPAGVDPLLRLAREHGHRGAVIGHVHAGVDKAVRILPHHLLGHEGRFERF